MEIPMAVLLYARERDFDGIRLIEAGNPEFGDVFALGALEDTETPMPTGLPFLVSYKGGVCTEIPMEETMALLSGLDEE